MDNQKPIKTSFWDFKNPKVYTTPGESIIDFVLGGCIMNLPISYLFSKIMSYKFKQLGEIGAIGEATMPIFSFKNVLHFLIPFFVLIILAVIGVFYFWKRRKAFAYGLLVSLIFDILALYLSVM